MYIYMLHMCSAEKPLDVLFNNLVVKRRLMFPLLTASISK